MAQRKRKQKKKSRKTKPEPYPGWMWMLFGLSVGLSVAFAIYMKDRDRWLSVEPVAQEPASMAVPIEAPPQPGPQPETSSEETPAEASEPRFSFYSMLPNFEVVIPEEEPDVTRDRAVEAIQAPGTYVLQAGSFSDQSDADRRRAELALLGIESQIQRISIDDRTYHRVRIGPVNDLDELNLLRSQLRQAGIDVLRIRLGE
jgi:cell division protein FtsN